MRYFFLSLLFLLPACSSYQSASRIQPPPNAPAQVRRAIVAVNEIVGKPYKWGGGHGSFQDRGYDCSGTVSYLLHAAGGLSSPEDSQSLSGWGIPGHGRWITVYVRPGRHVFAEVAGYRLDTTDFNGGGGNVGPRWHQDHRSTAGYEARTLAWL
jgi:hypothetical protein